MPWRVYRPGDRGRPQRDRRDGQGRRPLLLLPADQAAARHACRPGCRWSASTSATPTSSRSTTSPRRWTTSPTSPGHDGEAFHLVNPEPQPVVEMVNAFCAAAGAPRFATPVDRGSRRGGLLGLLPGAAAAAPARQQPGPHRRRSRRVLDQTIGRLGIPAEVLAHTSFRAGLRLPAHREGAGRLRASRCPTSSPTPRTLWGYWEEHLDQSTAPRRRRPRGARPGKYVVITGASSGIGQVTALKVAQAGGIPVLVARGKDKLEDDPGRRSRTAAARRTSTRATSPTSRRSTRCASS